MPMSSILVFGDSCVSMEIAGTVAAWASLWRSSRIKHQLILDFILDQDAIFTSPWDFRFQRTCLGNRAAMNSHLPQALGLIECLRALVVVRRHQP